MFKEYDVFSDLSEPNCSRAGEILPQSRQGQLQ